MRKSSFFLVALLGSLFSMLAHADSYQIYLPSQSSFDPTTRTLPTNLQKLWIVNTDSNVVKQVSMTNYLARPFQMQTQTTFHVRLTSRAQDV